MASIQQEIWVYAPTEFVWQALRDVGRIHERLVPGFVRYCRLEGDIRVLRFGNGMRTRELILDVDPARRRVAWSAQGRPFRHHNASVQARAENGGTRLVWIADVLPNELTPHVGAMIEQALRTMKHTLERDARQSLVRVVREHTGALLSAEEEGSPITIETPWIAEVGAQVAAVVRIAVPRARIAEVMEPSIGELMSTLNAQGIAPAGPLFAHHLGTDEAGFDFELGVPVATAVSASGRVRAGALPGGRVARSVYRGGYEGLYAAWDELGDWVRAQGYRGGPNLWERYLVGPESGADPVDWRTELNLPLRD